MLICGTWLGPSTLNPLGFHYTLIIGNQGLTLSRGPECHGSMCKKSQSLRTPTPTQFPFSSPILNHVGLHH